MFQLLFGKQKNVVGSLLKLEVLGKIEQRGEMDYSGMVWESRESNMNWIFRFRKQFDRQRWREEVGWDEYDILRGQRWGN